MSHDFGNQVAEYYRNINLPLKLPQNIEILMPYQQAEVQVAINKFCNKYYRGTHERVFLLGINPGRFGAGVTGICFTDSIKLQEILGIENNFKKRAELSSDFIYEMIEAMGGPADFYNRFYITAVSPLGFIREGKNLNYYDDKTLQNKLKPWIHEQLQLQLDMAPYNEVAFSIGKGKNLEFLKKINREGQYFREIRHLPHPRWVLQYRRKQKEYWIEQCTKSLTKFL